MLLSIRNLDAGYGRKQILFGLSLELMEGECLGLIGANGSGKSTLLKAVSGLADVFTGDVIYGGRSIGGMSTSARSVFGIAFAPQGCGVFDELTVLENLEVGAHAMPFGKIKARMADMLDLFPHLAPLLHRRARSLSGGERQMLAISRAMIQVPRLLMLDEPSLGLAPAVASEVLHKVREYQRVSRFGMLLVEQRVRYAIAFSDKVYCLREGRVIDAGSSQEFATDRRRVSRVFG